MTAPDFQAMGDPLNDRLPPRRTKVTPPPYITPPPYLSLPCEGSNLVGHACWRGDLLGAGVMCQMCGQWFAPLQDTHHGVPEHRRPDILAMLDRGDFDNG